MNRSSRWSRCQTNGKKCVKAERRTIGPALSRRGKGVRNPPLSVEGGETCFKGRLMEGGGVARGGGDMRIQKPLFSKARRREGKGEMAGRGRGREGINRNDGVGR